jgi:anti-sigma B factor antagonist
VSFFAVHDFSERGRHTFVLSGELDIAEGEQVVSALQRVGPQATAITLDLSELTFMGATGLRAVLFTRELCRQRGYEFRIVPGKAQVQHIFEMAGLVGRLPFQAVDGAPPSVGPKRVS